MWLHADNISCIHGFSTRFRGVSPAPFDSLNLGGSEDDPKNIQQNRTRALQALHLSIDDLCLLKQIHSADVCVAEKGIQTGDALVTNQKNRVLVVSAADCYPLLFQDPENKVIGAAHAGWRGTCARIVRNTIKEMINLGASAENIRVAIGQGISQKNYEVGEEVINTFRAEKFAENCFDGRQLNLIQCNTQVLLESGIHPENIWVMNRCSTESDFFSHRRDKGKTGRMWGLIAISD